MLRFAVRETLLIAIFGLTVGASAQAAVPPEVKQQPKVVLKYTPNVPADQSVRLNQDLIFLDRMNFKDTDGEMQRIMKLPAVNAAEMQKWLSLRAKVVLDEKFVLDENSLTIMAVNVQYPKPDEMPQFGRSNSVTNNESSGGSPGGTIIMSNMGGVLYLLGKQNKILIALIAGDSVVPVNSPRAGILQIGAGLFEVFAQPRGFKSIGDRLYSIFRLSTLFHEARHSDGNGATALFGHTNCPEGHDLQGAPACDTPANGPYRIDALFTHTAAAAFTDASPVEREVLNLLRLDGEHRILSPIRAGQPGRGQNADLCAFLNQLELKPDFCQVRPTDAPIVEWDDHHETL